MNQFTNAFTDMWTSMIMFLPSIVKALVLFLIAWLVAVAIKKLVQKALLKMNVDEKLARGKRPSDPEYGKEKVKNLAQVAYFLVFLLFLPSILDALAMDSVSAPISNMMNNLLAFIPRLIGAAIIGFIGYFIAKIIRDLTYMFLQTVNIDKWYNKITTKAGSGTIDQSKKNTLADVLSKVVFGLVLIPVVTLALETLNIRTLTEPIVIVLNKVMEMIPNVLVAIVLVVAGYYIASFVSKLLEELLSRMGINRVFGFMNDSVKKDALTIDISKIIATIVKVLIILFITVESLGILKLDVLNAIGYGIIGYLPLVISGILIIGIGLLAGYFVESLINKYTKSPYTAAIAKYIIIVFSVFMTLEQIKFASTIVNIAFLLVLGGLSVAFAVAFGVGGRDFAARQLAKFEAKVEKENKKPVPEGNMFDKMKETEKNNPTDL
ncbi:MAG: mechanosensitive ion channel [Clostridium sp.]|nr:mechanosensitive ion channel [Clostridium sp.]